MEANVSKSSSAEVSQVDKPIDPLFNAAFLRIFGQEESKNLTRNLINAFLSKAGLEPIGEIESIESEHTAIAGSVECKTPRMDVRIITAGKRIDLEAQTYPTDIESRSMLYGAQLLTESIDKGTTYRNMPQAIVITLLDDSPRFPESDSFVSVSRMEWRNASEEYLDASSDRLLFVLVELSKIRARYNSLTESVLADEAVAWGYLLTSGFSNQQEVESIVEEFPTMEEFAERYGFAIGDPKVKRAYEDALSAEREYESRQRYYASLKEEAVARGLEEGREQGLEQGWQQGVEQLARKLQETGVDKALIEKAIAEISKEPDCE